MISLCKVLKDLESLILSHVIDSAKTQFFMNILAVLIQVFDEINE